LFFFFLAEVAFFAAGEVRFLFGSTAPGDDDGAERMVFTDVLANADMGAGEVKLSDEAGASCGSKGAGWVKLSDNPGLACEGVVSGAVGVTAVVTRGCATSEVGIDCLAGTTV